MKVWILVRVGIEKVEPKFTGIGVIDQDKVAILIYNDACPPPSLTQSLISLARASGLDVVVLVAILG